MDTLASYISHRVLRWTITPIALFLLIPLNTALLLMQVTPVWLYQLFAVGQILFYMIALLGWYLAHRSLQSKLLFIPYYFLFMNLNVFKGMGYLKNFKGSAVWEKAERR